MLYGIQHIISAEEKVTSAESEGSEHGITSLYWVSIQSCYLSTVISCSFTQDIIYKVERQQRDDVQGCSNLCMEIFQR